MLEDLKEEVLRANLMLPRYGLVLFTWGNASGIDRDKGLVVIKPSGLSYDEMKAGDMVVVDMEGNIVEGSLRPSSDTPTHLELYKAFGEIGGIVHTHSRHATAFAQAGRGISCFGTTQGDYFCGEVPVTRALSPEEINGAYEKETGKLIAETFADKNPNYIPGVLVRSHGPFTWGADACEAAHNAAVLEEIAFMNFRTLMLNPDVGPVSDELLHRHFFRKHGADAYYGQK